MPAYGTSLPAPPLKVLLEFVSNPTDARAAGCFAGGSREALGGPRFGCVGGEGPPGRLSPAAPAPHGVSSAPTQTKPLACPFAALGQNRAHSRHVCRKWAFQNIFEKLGRWLRWLKFPQFSTEG